MKDALEETEEIADDETLRSKDQIKILKQKIETARNRKSPV
tara:strand:+ start:230 stop:352 length:123 start_codon:yes stop_codon:yes gene_type:complete